MDPEVVAQVEEWYESTKEWEASGGASSTDHLLLLLTAVLSCVDMKHFKNWGMTPLHALAGMEKKSKKAQLAEDRGVNMLGSVKLLQKCGLDIDTHNKFGGKTLTPLHDAACRGHFDLVRGLVERGADINLESVWGETALTCAAGNDNPLTLTYLLRHGAEVEGSKALRLAAIAGSPDCMKALLKAWGKPNEGDRQGYTEAAQLCCMEKAKKRGRAEVLSLLLESGAHVKVEDAEGLNLLLLAAKYGNADCIPHLLEKGLEIDCRDSNMQTPLHHACFRGKLACVKELLRRGASPDLGSSTGLIALMQAVVGGHVEIASELIGAGASVNAKANHSVTALHFAAALGSMEMAYLLVEGGADVSALAENQETSLMTCMRPDDSKVYAKLSLIKTSPGAKEAREKVAAFLLKVGAAVDGKVVALAGEKGFGDVLASSFTKGRLKVDAVSDRLNTVAQHYSVTADGDDEKTDDVVQVRLVNKATGERGGKQYSLSIPLVGRLMESIGGGEDGMRAGNASGGAGRDASAAGILPTVLDPAKYGYKSGKKGKGKGKKNEIELAYDGVNFTEEGFEAVVKFVTTGSVEELLTRRPGSLGKRKRGTNSSSGSGEGEDESSAERGNSSSSSSSGGGRVTKGRAKLFDDIRAKQALQAAEFFCLEGLSREVKALMSEYGFALQEETGGDAREGSEEGRPSRKRRKKAGSR